MDPHGTGRDYQHGDGLRVRGPAGWRGEPVPIRAALDDRTEFTVDGRHGGSGPGVAVRPAIATTWASVEFRT